MRRACIMLAVAAAVAWGAVPGGSAAAADPVPASAYGINGQWLFALPYAQWAPQLSAVAADGLGIVRKDATWAQAEPDPPDADTGTHTFVWWPFDLMIASMARAGLTWYPILDYGSPWAGAVPGDDRSAPDPAAFSAYAAAFAARYGRDGAFWAAHPEVPYTPVTSYEIWNEPNLPIFWPDQSDAAERYIDLYLAARTALHGVDPQATVVAGALSSGTPDHGVAFVQRMIAHRPDAVGQVDAFSYHPYADDAQASGRMIAQIRTAVDAAFGFGVPLHITEVGWSTVGAMTEDGRGQALAWLAGTLPVSGCDVTELIPHTWLSPELDPANPGDWYGIHHADGTASPSEQAYAAAVLAAEHQAPVADPSTTVCRPPPDVTVPDTSPVRHEGFTVHLPPPPPPVRQPPPPPVHHAASPQLTAVASVRGRTVTLRVRSAAGAAPPRTVVATRAGRSRALPRTGAGVYRRTLPTRGRWRIVVHSAGTYSWTAQTLVRHVRLAAAAKR